MKKNVLLIEDDLAIADMLQRYLRTLGFDVDVVQDGVLGLKRVLASPPEILVVDGLLPGVSGLEIIKQTRAHHGAKVRILLVSAVYTTAHARREAVQAGADLVMGKPFVASELKSCLADLARDREFKRSTTLHDDASTNAPAATGAASSMITPTGKQNVKRSPGEGGKTLLALARARRTVRVRFTSNADVVDVQLRSGVVVAVRGTHREDGLLTRMERSGLLSVEQAARVNERMVSSNDRAGSAAVHLGYLTADVVLLELEAQSRARLHRAALWNEGEVEVVDDDLAADTDHVSAFDVQDEVLNAHLLAPHPHLCASLLNERRDDVVTPLVDFDNGLIPFARLRPTSMLPQRLLGGERRVEALIDGDAARVVELFAMWQADMIGLNGDEAPTTMLPRVLRTNAEASVLSSADRHHATLRRALVRARGGGHYALLEVSPTSSRQEIIAAIASKRSAFRPPVSSDAVAAADDRKEMEARLADAAYVLLDENRRHAHDASRATPSALSVVSTAEGERAYWMGQELIRRGETKAALGCFEDAVKSDPRQPDYIAWLAWATFEQASAGLTSAETMLEAAVSVAPTAMRPRLFLGLMALSRREHDAARRHLEEAARLSPGDVEVNAALARLPPRPGEP